MVKKRNSVGTILMIFIIIIPFLVISTPVLAADKVVVYTCSDVDEMELWAPAAEKALGMKIHWSPRFSCQEEWSRLQAEAPNFLADMVWNIMNTHAMIGKERGYFIPYKSSAWADIPGKFKDPDGYWYGFNYWFTAITVNKDQLKKKNLPAPKSWKDLANPVYKGEIVMPNPGTSGTAFLAVATVMQGWEFLEKLDKNVAQYTRSGSAPAQMVAMGEYPIAISWDQAIFGRVDQGYPVEGIIPSEGTAYNLACLAILKGCKNLEGAKKLVDWIGTKEAMILFGKLRSKVTRPGIPSRIKTDPELIKYDVMWAALNEKRIMTSWQERFGK